MADKPSKVSLNSLVGIDSAGLTELAGNVLEALHTPYVVTKEEKDTDLKNGTNFRLTYIGKTCMQVTLLKAAQNAAAIGDFTAMDRMLNRSYGRPISLALSKEEPKKEPGMKEYLKECQANRNARKELDDEL